MGQCARKHSNPRGAGRGLGLADVAIDPREAILQECAAAAPQPWYPRRYAETESIDRNRLDAPLDDLRLHNLHVLREESRIAASSSLTDYATRLIATGQPDVLVWGEVLRERAQRAA